MGLPNGDGKHWHALEPQARGGFDGRPAFVPIAIGDEHDAAQRAVFFERLDSGPFRSVPPSDRVANG